LLCFAALDPGVPELTPAKIYSLFGGAVEPHHHHVGILLYNELYIDFLTYSLRPRDRFDVAFSLIFVYSFR
jgi:hypothetical protein